MATPSTVSGAGSRRVPSHRSIQPSLLHILSYLCTYYLNHHDKPTPDHSVQSIEYNNRSNNNNNNNNNNSNNNNNNNNNNNAQGQGQRRDGICFAWANGQHCRFGERCHYRHEFPAGYVPAAAPESTTAPAPAPASQQTPEKSNPRPQSNQNQGKGKGNTY